MKIILGSYDRIPHRYHHQFLGALEEWTISDINPRHPDIAMIDARDIPYRDVEAIYASHVLEHIHEAEHTLAHWYDVLKEGGWVHINVPDMAWALDNLMLINAAGVSMSPYFDTQEKMWQVINGTEESEFDTHKSWWNRGKLSAAMKQAGFKNVTISEVYEAHDMGCLIAKGYK